MSASKTKKRDPLELYDAIKQAELDDDYEEIAAMSPSELDTYIRENGGDPEGIRARGAALGEQIRARLDRSAWQADAQTKIASHRKDADAVRTKVSIPRDKLLERLTAARKNPSFPTGVAALFRDKSLEDSTDEELRALLEQVEVLAQLHKKK